MSINQERSSRRVMPRILRAAGAHTLEAETVDTSHRSKSVGLLVAALSVAAITGAIFPLRQVVPALSTGVLYLLAVLLVSTWWGVWLGLITSLASAAAFNFFHIPPTGRFTIANNDNWVALVVYFAAAVVTSTLADSARARTVEAEERRREADLAAELARLVLGGVDGDDGLAEVGPRIAAAVGIERAELRIEWLDGDEQRAAIPLVDGGERVGTLLVPRDLDSAQRERLERRVVPPLTALVSAATRRRRLEEQVVETRALRRSDVMKTALLRAVSHDLRSPLTAIRTAAAGVASPTVGEEDRAEMAAVIATESERLAQLVENLLDLSRLESGSAEPRREWCSVDEIIESAGEGVRARGAQLDVNLDPELPLIQADSAQLERALWNLLENAARYSNGEPVSVRAHVSGKRLLLRITDRGPGIDAAQLEHIFEPFYRLDGDSLGGSGLGLAIARGFVEANGGRLRAQSLPGQGASFLIELPLEGKG
jgi:two-component system, OmpR family, sensor histidine kinase KdpD